MRHAVIIAPVFSSMWLLKNGVIVFRMLKLLLAKYYPTDLSYSAHSNIVTQAENTQIKNRIE